MRRRVQNGPINWDFEKSPTIRPGKGNKLSVVITEPVLSKSTRFDPKTMIALKVLFQESIKPRPNNSVSFNDKWKLISEDVSGDINFYVHGTNGASMMKHRDKWYMVIANYGKAEENVIILMEKNIPTEGIINLENYLRKSNDLQK